MADKRSEYIVEIGGIEHTFLLTEDDAKRYPGAKKGSAKSVAAKAVAALGVAQGTAPADAKAAAAPENKSGPTPADK